MSFQFNSKICAPLLGFLFFFAVRRKMLLASMQQDEATWVQPVFVTSAWKLRSFLLVVWAILQTTKWHEIKTLECVQFCFVYLCSAYIHKIGTSCLIVLPFSFLLKMTDVEWITHIVQGLKCAISVEEV